MPALRHVIRLRQRHAFRHFFFSLLIISFTLPFAFDTLPLADAYACMRVFFFATRADMATLSPC